MNKELKINLFLSFTYESFDIKLFQTILIFRKVWYVLKKRWQICKVASFTKIVLTGPAETTFTHTEKKMASLDGGPQKKRKTDDELLESFHDSFLGQNPSFVDAVNRFKDITTGLGAFTIGSCNAADPDNGCSLNKAVCTIKPTQRVFAFANFFVDAFKMLKNFVTKREIPSDSEMKMLLLCLIRFLVNTGNLWGMLLLDTVSSFYV